jgi:hypothetical protein
MLEMDYTIRINHSYRGHHYILQNVLVLKDCPGDFLYDGASSHFVGDPATKENGHMANACAGRHMMRVAMLSPKPVN